MRRLVFVSVLLLVACGDKQEVSQSSGGDYSPNVVAGGNVSVQQNTTIQNATINMPPEMLEKLAQALKAQGVPADQLNAQLEELERKYADLEQRLGEYAKTDELAQQARKELDLGNLDQAETLLQQAYDKDFQLTRERLAQRAFDLAEVAELRLDHDKALARYREVTQLQPDNLQAWKSLLEIARKVGNNGLALKAAQGFTQHATQDKEWLAVALIDEGDALAKLGDNNAALTKYRESYELREKLAKESPDNLALQRFLSVSHDRIGDLSVATGDRAAALKSYQDSLLTAQKLVELDPEQTEWQCDLSVSHDKLGNLYKATGDRAAVLKSYQDSLSIRKTLVELDPKQTEWQRNLSISYNKIGDLYVATGDRAAALKSYQDSLSIRKTLVELDPKQTEWQRDLSVSHDRIGDLYIAIGDRAAALKSYQDSLSIRKTLAELDPKQAEWQTDIVVSYFKLSEVEPAKKTQYLQDALKILQTLHAENRLSKDKQAWIETIQGKLGK